MIERLSKFGDVRAQSSVIFGRGAGMQFSAAVLGKRFGCRQRAGELESLHHHVHVAGISIVVGADRGSVQRIAGAQADIAPAIWMQESRTESKCVTFNLLEAVLHKIANAKMKLQVGNLRATGGFDESASLRHVGS